MSDYIEGGIPLRLVAAAAKMRLEDLVDEAARLGIHTGTSWSGEPAVKESDAQALVSGEARRTAQHDQAKAQYQAAEQRWTAERGRVYQESYYATFNRVGGARGGRASDEAAREAATEAVQEFQRANPAPVWNGHSTPNMFQRVASKIAETVR